jgi:predicted ATPase/class 3 adenylate cyclase
MPAAVFLFTDIEGSTRLWADHPDEMALALARHDDLMDAAVRRADGHIFKHSGDGICAVFPSVSQAVRAAADAQRGLATQDGGPLGRLRVRMAVHAGEAEQRGDDWFGPTLNRTARLMGIGHGRQVLLSAAAHELVSDGLPEFRFADLGPHRLRDLTRPEHVWQLVGDGLQRSFPPLRSFDGIRGQLPSYLTSFVGRGAEMASVSAELLAAPLVTLVGPGGVGKSRLATQLGAALIDKFPDGAWMFELAGLSHADALEASMLATLGRSGTSATNPREELFDTVRSWRALLIVDNCEHLLRVAADLVRSLLAVGPDLTVLATSREPLQIEGEHVIALGPLTVAGDAVELFVERARSRRQSFDADANRDAMVRICEHLDGMPLAIELAAARTVAMTPIELERRLDQRFRLLADRAGEADRHGSLRRVVEWSYDLLDQERKAFFVRLSVFAGSFDEQAAHVVCGDEDELATIEMLEDLVNKSLVVATPLGERTSYRLLETMRQYGASLLSAQARAELEERHGDYFADLAERSWDGMRGADSQAWLDLLDDQFDDVRAACERALFEQRADRAVQITGGLFMYNHTRRLPEIYGWLERALDMPGAREERLARHARLHWAYGVYMDRRLEEAGEMARAVIGEGSEGSDTLEPLALVVLSGVAGNSNRVDEAAELAIAAVERALAMGPAYDYDRAEAMWNLCTIAFSAGAPDATLAGELLALARGLGNARAIAGGLLQSGLAEADAARGGELLAQARDLTARTRDTYRYALATLWLGLLDANRSPQKAIELIPELVRHVRATGQRLLVFQLRALTIPLSVLGRHEAVAVLHGSSNVMTIRPELVAEAVARAQEALGEERYGELLQRGKKFSPGEVEDYLLGLVSTDDERALT